MTHNSFGTLFRITSWGESHGPAVGVVIDGCPAGLYVSTDELHQDMRKRAPGNSPYTSPRKEPDQIQILSGLYEGKTTGAPISMLIPNLDVDSSSYEPFTSVLRPGHAQYTYLQKYGCYDHRGGGRASARETVARVAAGAVARQLLQPYGIQAHAYVCQVGESTRLTLPEEPIASLAKKTNASPIFCPDPTLAIQMMQIIQSVQQAGDSIGGIVECIIESPAGLGEPIFDKLDALLAHAMLSIPASKGFEIGEGFACALQKGSAHNDLFIPGKQGIAFATNHAGGLLGGISTGEKIHFRVPFKPTSSISQTQNTLSWKGENTTLTMPPHARHDPCIAIRAAPVVEAMALLVLADAFLLQKTSRL